MATTALSLEQLRTNAYRVLGTSAAASQAQIDATARRMRIWPDPARIPPTPWDVPGLGPLGRSRPEIEQAVARLYDPARRLRERLLWYHGAQPLTAVPTVLPGAAGARHDAGVAALHTALHVAARGATGEHISELWRMVLASFIGTAGADGVAWVEQTEAAGAFEKRASPAEIRAACAELVAAAAGVVLTQARQAIDDGHAEAGLAQIRLVKGAGAPALTAQATDMLEDAISAACAQVDAYLRKELRTDHHQPHAFYSRNEHAMKSAGWHYAHRVVILAGEFDALTADQPDRRHRVMVQRGQLLQLMALGWEWAGRLEYAEARLVEAAGLLVATAEAHKVERELTRVRQLRAVHTRQQTVVEGGGGFKWDPIITGAPRGGATPARRGNLRVATSAPRPSSGSGVRSSRLLVTLVVFLVVGLLRGLISLSGDSQQATDPPSPVLNFDSQQAQNFLDQVPDQPLPRSAKPTPDDLYKDLFKDLPNPGRQAIPRPVDPNYRDMLPGARPQPGAPAGAARPFSPGVARHER